MKKITTVTVVLALALGTQSFAAMGGSMKTGATVATPQVGMAAKRAAMTTTMATHQADMATTMSAQQTAMPANMTVKPMAPSAPAN